MVQTRSTTSTANRKPRAKKGDSVGALRTLVTRLIAENKKLKTQIERASTKATTSVAPRALATLARKAERALAGSKPVKAVRRKPTAPRRPVSPETAEKRRQALAKARAAIAEKRAAGVATRSRE
jgi:hypothetical protein